MRTMWDNDKKALLAIDSRQRFYFMKCDDLKYRRIFPQDEELCDLAVLHVGGPVDPRQAEKATGCFPIEVHEPSTETLEFYNLLQEN